MCNNTPIPRHPFPMKNIKTLSLLLALFSYDYAFGQFDWQQAYGLPKLDESLNFIYPAAESGYFWAAGMTTAKGHDDLLLVKLDSTGQVIQADTFGSPVHNEYLWSFHRDPTTGTMWIAGSRTNFEETETRGFLLKLENDGSFSWEFISPQTVHETAGYVSIIGLPDGGAAALLHQQSHGGGQIQRLDGDGHILFSENLPNGGIASNLSQLLAPLPDGRFYFFHNTGSPFALTAKAELSLRSNDGTVIWKREVIAPDGENITITQNITANPSDGSVFVMTRRMGNSPALFLIKVDENGDQSWSVYPWQEQNMRVKMASDTSVALISSRSIDVRHIETGERLNVQDFSDEIFYWDRALHDAAFTTKGYGTFVGETTLTGSFDGYFGSFRTGTDDIALLHENYIGSYGPDGEDYSPLITQVGGYIFMASNFDALNLLSFDMQLRKIDPADGTELWVTTLSAPLRDLHRALLPASDGTLLLVNETRLVTSDMTDPQEIVIRKLDPEDGDVIWETRVLNPSPQHPALATATSDGGAVVIFNGSVPDPGGGTFGRQNTAVRLSSNGDILWQRWIEPTWSSMIDGGQRTIDDLIELRNGDFVAVGSEENQTGLVLRIHGTDGSSQLLSLLDPETSIQIRRVTSVIELDNGELMILAPNTSNSDGLDSVLQYRLAPDGDLLLRKRLRMADWHSGSRLMLDADGHPLLLLSHFYVSSGLPAGLTLRRINPDFETLAETMLYDTRWQPNSAALLDDGSIAITRTVTLTNSQDLWLAKTEGLPLVGTRFIKPADMGLTLSPNPLRPGQELQIVLENDYSGSLQIDFFSIDGRFLYGHHFEKTEYSQTFKLDKLTSAPSFWVLVKQGEASVGRLILRP